MLKLLIVEPDAGVSAVLKEGVEAFCAAVVTCAASGRVAAEVLCHQEFDLALMAVLLPDLCGFDLACAAADRNLPVLLMSAHPENQELCRIYGFPHIAKPFRPSELASLAMSVTRDAEENILRVRQACARLLKALETGREATPSNRLTAESWDRVTECTGDTGAASPKLFCPAGTLVSS